MGDDGVGPTRPIPRMRGNNELHFCGAEMIAMVQEYLSARMGEYAPFVTNVRAIGTATFVVAVTDEPPSV